MGVSTTFTKQLAAAGSNNIATSQSASAGVALTLNGSTSNRLSTTTTAAAAVGATVLKLTSVSGLVVGQPVTDSTTSGALVAGTVVTAVGAANVSIWPPVAGSVGVGSGDTIVFGGTATIDTVAAANSAAGRRVVIAYTGSDTSFAIVGTNASGDVITDTAVGTSGSATSNLDFVTVTSITPVGGGLTGVTAGTTGVGASQWNTWNWRGYAPVNISAGIEVVSGSVNFTVQHTYDDPNNLPAGLTSPTAFNDPVLVSQTATIDGLSVGAIKASRVLINSGTGEVRCRFVQAGAG